MLKALACSAVSFCASIGKIFTAKVGGFFKVSGGRRDSKIAAIGTVILVTLLSSVGANAALDAAVTDLITALAADVASLFAAVVVLWASIRGFMAAFKLGNKFISKAGA